MKIRYEEEIITTKLGKALLEKRGTRPLREAAREAGLSIATLNRMERGGRPDFDTFIVAMKWLKVPSTQWVLYSTPRQS